MGVYTFSISIFALWAIKSFLLCSQNYITKLLVWKSFCPMSRGMFRWHIKGGGMDPGGIWRHLANVSRIIIYYKNKIRENVLKCFDLSSLITYTHDVINLEKGRHLSICAISGNGKCHLNVYILRSNGPYLTEFLRHNSSKSAIAYIVDETIMAEFSFAGF